MQQDLKEIFTLLKTIEKIESYTKKNADPDTFFAANYQRNFNDKINLLITISEELRKKESALKVDIANNTEETNSNQ